MNARDLVADVPDELLAAIERQRTVSPQILLGGVVAMAALVGWVWWLDAAASAHHHQTALWLGLVPIVVLDVAVIAGRRLRPDEPEALTAVGRLALWTSVAGFASLTALAVHRDGAFFGVLVGCGVVLPALALLGRCGTWLSRQSQVARGRVRHLRLTREEMEEWSADRAAWAAANNAWRMGEGPLRRWMERRPQSTLPSARVVPATSGVDVLVGADMERWARRLGPGIERTLDDGRVLVSHAQLQRTDGLALVSINGRILSVSGSAGWFRRRFDWRRHAATVVAAEIARGPTALVSAITPSDGPAEARLRHFVLAAGTGGPVPIGSLADRRARVPRLNLPAHWWNGPPRPGIELIPPPASAAWTDGNASAPLGPPRRLVDDLAALLPGLQADPDPSMPRDQSARLRLAERPDRTVLATIVPAERLWTHKEELQPFELLVRCDALGLVTLLRLDPTSRNATLQSVSALLRREEVALEQIVYVETEGGGDHRTVPVHTRPAANRLPLLARGLRFGTAVIWWPPLRAKSD